ncbi:hypothetical protein R6Q59_008392 [Mikania micrantha]|uniref:Uncharacterized protein n=1 Tax=Mikania micrantha TaxID=192012 RepID=A0A5N6Q4X5_9ASTR|nr:hypothetical protein E3N88_02778 [Mikania micrantha]
MGACVSSHHKSSTMKVHISSVSDRKPDNHVLIVPSPVKEKLPIVDGNVAVKPQWPPLQSTAISRDFGSKEETFFDSQAWLDSDCESDFMSVNGEFTPSRGSTPVHRNFSATPPPPTNGDAAAIVQPSPSPTKKNKRLSELFSESQRENPSYAEENGEPVDENGAVGSIEAPVVRGGVVKPKRERWVEIVQVNGCLPRVLSRCRSVTHQTN